MADCDDNRTTKINTNKHDATLVLNFFALCFNMVHTNPQPMHHGQALEQFVYDNKVNVKKLADDLDVNRGTIYKWYERERFRKTELESLKRLIGFDVDEQKATQLNNLSNKVDSNPVGENTEKRKEAVGGFATYLYDQFAEIDEVRGETRRLAVWLEIHETRINNIEKDVEKLKENSHV